MKIKRKIWALLLSAAMIFTFLPAAAFAEGETSSDIITPVSAVWVGDGFLRGVIGTVEIYNLETSSNLSSFEVTYSDGSRKRYKYDGEYKDGYSIEGFLLEGEDLSNEKAFLTAYLEEEDCPGGLKEDENEDVPLTLSIPCLSATDGKPTGTNEIIKANVEVICPVERPDRVEFIPADGSDPSVCIGENYLTEETFYGEGNAFTVRYLKYFYKDGYQPYSVTFTYQKYEADGEIIEGFFTNDNEQGKPAQFVLADGVFCYLEKGKTDVEFVYSEIIDSLTEPVEVPFRVTVNADKYGAYAYPVEADYTGKAISKKTFDKKLVVYDSVGNVIPKSAYTYTWKPQKKIGYYDVDITFKDKTKYVDSIVASFRIGPKTPKITKLTGKKKAVTVRWKKFTKSQLKNIDGMYIELATDKDFMENYKIVTVSKKALKKGTSKTIKKLKGKKKYYVRLSTYKKVKTSEGTDWVFSGDSSKKSAKTKK